MSIAHLFNSISSAVAQAAGRPSAFVACCVLILVWGASGPLFGFSDTWQLIINTTTTIVTFLMVFLIQNTQNRDGVAIQAKLDELIRVSKGENHFIGIEHLPADDVEAFRKRCEDAVKAHNNALRSQLKEEVAEELRSDLESDLETGVPVGEANLRRVS